MKAQSNLKRGDRVRITDSNGTIYVGTAAQVRSKVSRIDLELDGFDYTKTNFQFHSFSLINTSVEVI